MDPRTPEPGDVFELRVALRGIKPEIWRRLLVPAELALGELHHLLQVAFGWEDSHLHDFMVGSIRFGMADVEDESFAVDELGAPLGAVANVGTSFLYRYDYGDDWEHDVVVEKVIPAGEGLLSCTDGARACPPEDCGGPPGYQRLLEVLADPTHPEHKDTKTWAGRGYDPAKLNLAAGEQEARLVVEASKPPGTMWPTVLATRKPTHGRLLALRRILAADNPGSVLAYRNSRQAEQCSVALQRSFAAKKGQTVVKVAEEQAR